MGYLIYKLIHIVSVILFLGNITVGFFWGRYAHKNGDSKLVASVFQGIIRSDRWFTIPGVIGILVSGFGAAARGNLPILATGWILWGIILFLLSGLFFSVWIAPLQKKIFNLVNNVEMLQEIQDLYEKYYRKWKITGFLAWITPVIALVIMVLKLKLPAF